MEYLPHPVAESPAQPLPIRRRDRFFVPAAPRNSSLLTGYSVRRPHRVMLTVTDPVSAAPSPLALWHYPADSSKAAAGVAHPEQLFMVHGFRGDHHGLALVADCLPHVEIFVPDLPGFGDSPALPDAEHNIASYVHVLQQVQEQFSDSSGRSAVQLGRNTTLLGHSFGSVIASHWAAENPTQWQSLVLLNPICEPALDVSGSPFDRVAAWVTQRYYALAASLPESLGRAVLGNRLIVWATGTLMSKTQDRRTLAYLHDQHQRYFSAFDTRHMLLEAYRASVSSTVLDVADRLTLPVLSVVGRDDELGSVAAQQHLAEQMRRSSGDVSLEVLDGVGHLIHYERPRETGNLIRVWSEHVKGVHTDSH